MKLIKQAISYKCDLPSAAALEQHLATHPFRDPGEAEYSSAGFIPVLDERYVFPFPDGYCFKLQLDEKILPQSVVTKEANARIAKLDEEQDERLPTKEVKRIHEEVYFELLKKALVKTSYVMAYYRPKDKLLIVATSNKSMAAALTNRLINAVGSIKATTIYIDGITKSLSAQLRNALQGGEGFSGFNIGGICKLKGEQGKALNVKVGDIQEANAGLIEALNAGHKVVELELGNEDVTFVLNHKFILRSIVYHPVDWESEPFDNRITEFEHDASKEMLWLSSACQQLLTLFEYKEPVGDAA
jgi:recombination associated protein RdgC